MNDEITTTTAELKPQSSKGVAAAEASGFAGTSTLGGHLAGEPPRQ
jgi:hypothetical protein